MSDELTDEELSRMKPARDVLKPELFEKLTDTDPYEKRAREIVEMIGLDMISMELSGSEAKLKHEAVISSALREAYDEGRKSEAAMWELARIGQEIDMCHASPEQADQSVSREDSALQSEPAPDAIPNAAVMIDYTNYRGERGLRRVIPDQISFGSNEWHREPQWLMLAYDCEKKAERIFSVRDIHSWRVPAEGPLHPSSRDTRLHNDCDGGFCCACQADEEDAKNA